MFDFDSHLVSLVWTGKLLVYQVLIFQLYLQRRRDWV